MQPALCSSQFIWVCGDSGKPGAAGINGQSASLAGLEQALH